MRNTSLHITVPHLFSPISSLSKESNSYITSLRFKIHGMFQINPSNFKSQESSIHEQTNRKHITTLVLISCRIAET